MAWPVSGRGKQLFYVSLLGDAKLNIEKLKAPEYSKVPWFNRRIKPHSVAKIHFDFGLIDKAHIDITWYRFRCSILFTVVLWNAILFRFFKNCKIKKAILHRKKNVTLKKKKDSNLESLPFIFVTNHKSQV